MLVKYSTSVTLLPTSLNVSTRITISLHISFVKAVVLINFLVRMYLNQKIMNLRLETSWHSTKFCVAAQDGVNYSAAIRANVKSVHPKGYLDNSSTRHRNAFGVSSLYNLFTE